MDPLPPLPALGNIAFWTSRFDESRRFYSEILGLPEGAAGDRPRHWVIYGTAAFSFSLNESSEAAPTDGWARCPMDPSTGDTWEAYFTVYVEDLDAVLTRCRAAGIELHQDEPFSLGKGFGRSVEARDPDGRTIALTER